jgi:hypothetical protein
MMVWNMWQKTTGHGADMKMKISQDTADSITKDNLKQWRTYLQSELDQWSANPKNELNPDGVWMHPDDVVGNTKYIMACTLIIDAFGG